MRRTRTSACLLALATVLAAVLLGGLAGRAGLAQSKPGAKKGLSLRWYGQSFFLLTSSGGTRIAIDPFNDIGYKLPDVSADAVTISHTHPDHNNPSLVKARDGKEPRVFHGTKNNLKEWVDVPRTKVGDVELYDVGVYHDDAEGKKIGKNAAFVFEADGLRLVHLGDLGHQLSDEQLKKIGRVEVVMVPVGGKYTIDAAGADRVLRQLEPRLIILPMHYRTPALKVQLEKVDAFLAGKDNVRKVDSATLDLRREDLPAKPEIVVLRYE